MYEGPLFYRDNIASDRIFGTLSFFFLVPIRRNNALILRVRKRGQHFFCHSWLPVVGCRGDGLVAFVEARSDMPV